MMFGLIILALAMLFVIVGVLASLAFGRGRRHGSSNHDGPETNLNIRAMIDDPWKKH